MISYLLKFVCGKPFECDHIRQNIDLYGNKKPCDILDELSPEGEATDVNYFFTQLKKESVNGKNFIRTMVGGGTWKGLDKDKPVFDKIKGSTIGLKKTLRFDDQHVWRMKEYYLSDKILEVLGKRGQIRREDLVLCRIKKKLVDQKNGGNITAGFMCSNIPMKIISSSGDENINVDSSEQGCVEDHNQYVDSISCANYIPEEEKNMNAGILSCPLPQKQRAVMCSNNSHDENIIVVSEQLEDQNYVPTSGLQEGFCANNDYEFQQQEEFERAKASVPPVEETLSALSNLLNGNEDHYSLLMSSFTTESNIKDPMSQMPHLISTDDQFSEQGTMMTSNGLPMIMSDQFQLSVANSTLCHTNCNSSSSALVFDEYCFPMDHIYTVDDQTQKFEPLTDDQLTKQGVNRVWAH